MGGVISTLFAGSFPERVGKLAVLEGLGPPDNAFEVGPLRMRRWIEGTRSMQTRSEKAFTRTEALQRLVANHQGVDPSILEHRLLHLVDEVGEGLVRWRFDPLHRTTSPMPFFAALFREFARKVACPTLAVSGGPSGYHPPGEEERLAAFPSLRQLTIKDAGHMMHWTRPSEVAAALVAFL